MNEQTSKIDTPEGREWLKGLLKERNVVVTFTKINGDERVMTCTLNESVLPQATKTDPQSQKKVREVDADKVWSVWDINAKGWRSFRWENVKQVDFTLRNENG